MAPATSSTTVNSHFCRIPSHFHLKNYAGKPALVERKAGVAADVEFVHGSVTFPGNQEADDFGYLFRLDEVATPPGLIR